MAVNNAATVFRPQLWCCADPPYRFSETIWRDPGVMKFLPIEQVQEQVSLTPETEVVSAMPNVFGYIRNLAFDPEKWLTEPSINYGNDESAEDPSGNRGVRSVLLAALKLLYVLGVRSVFLLGCDFRMEHNRPNYAFANNTSEKYVEFNNNSYEVLNERLHLLAPYFKANRFEVLNCTPESGLTAFPYIEFDLHAISNSRSLGVARVACQTRGLTPRLKTAPGKFNFP